VLFEDGDVRMLANLVRQGGLNGQAGRVGDVDDAPGTVAALLGQMVAVLIAGKGEPLFNQPVDCPATVLDHEARRPRVVEQRAGGNRVADVRFDRVAIVENCRDAALCPTRGAVFQCALADQRDLARCCQP
jgi:hypothetical protein